MPISNKEQENNSLPSGAGQETWVVLGDIHNHVASLARVPEFSGAAGAIITGDLTFAGGRSAAAKVLDAVAAHTPALLAQIGNMDKADVNALLEERGCNLHGKARRIAPGVSLIGLGGSTPTPFNTPSEFSEDKMALLLEKAYGEVKNGDALILVSHTPPLGTACDRIASGAHVGSRSVRVFIEKYRPALCFCGHIHEARAEDRIGPTSILNPGSFADGRYALLRLRAGEILGELRRV